MSSFKENLELKRVEQSDGYTEISVRFRASAVATCTPHEQAPEEEILRHLAENLTALVYGKLRDPVEELIAIAAMVPGNDVGIRVFELREQILKLIRGEAELEGE